MSRKFEALNETSIKLAVKVCLCRSDALRQATSQRAAAAATDANLQHVSAPLLGMGSLGAASLSFCQNAGIAKET